MKLMKSSLGVMTVAFEPSDLTHAQTEQTISLNDRVSPELFKLIEENQSNAFEQSIAHSGDSLERKSSDQKNFSIW